MFNKFHVLLLSLWLLPKSDNGGGGRPIDWRASRWSSPRAGTEVKVRIRVAVLILRFRRWVWGIVGSHARSQWGAMWIREFFFNNIFWWGPFLEPLLNLLQYCFCVMFWYFGPEVWDLTSPTRDQTNTPCTGRWSQPQDHQGSHRAFGFQMKTGNPPGYPGPVGMGWWMPRAGQAGLLGCLISWNSPFLRL